MCSRARSKELVISRTFHSLLFALARLNLPHPGSWPLQILPCSGTLLLPSWDIFSQERLSHRRVPSDLPHACGAAGSAEELYPEQRGGVQRVQAVSLRPGGWWVRAHVHWSWFLNIALKTKQAGKLVSVSANTEPGVKCLQHGRCCVILLWPCHAC